MLLEVGKVYKFDNYNGDGSGTITCITYYNEGAAWPLRAIDILPDGKQRSNGYSATLNYQDVVLLGDIEDFPEYFI